MRFAASLVVLVACSRAPGDTTVDAVPPDPDAAIDAAMGFGELGGMCGVLNAPELTGDAPQLVRDTFTFVRRFDDPADRPLLTEGGRRIIETPNAGGSSVFSEVFAFEQLARCEFATLVKTEVEIVYDQVGKLTDLSVEVDGVKIGVSVTRAVAFPFGSTYTLEAASTLISRKLLNIQESSANVSAADGWEKQILAVLAWDDAAADTVGQAWAALDASVRADSIVVVSVTHGDDVFIYSDQ